MKLFSKLCCEIHIFNNYKIKYKDSYTLIRNKSNSLIFNNGKFSVTDVENSIKTKMEKSL